MEKLPLKACVIKANARSDTGQIIPIEKTSARVFCHPPNSKSEEHAHDETHIIVIRSGQMRFFMEKQIYEVGTGDIIFIPPGIKHYFETISSNGADVVCFCVPKETESTRSNTVDQINHVNLNEVVKFAEEIKKNPEKARQTLVIEGNWNLDESKLASYSAEITYGPNQKKTVFEMDHAVFAGGGGNLPAPLQFGFFWIASCFAGTFAIIASFKGIKLQTLGTRVEADINWTQVFGIKTMPIMERVRMTVKVSASNATEAQLKEVEQAALQNCPAIATLQNPIPVTSKLVIEQPAFLV